MNVLGIFLNNEMRTGGHQRYLELMQGLAERGNGVRVIMNGALVRESPAFTRLNVNLSYKKGSRPFNGLKFGKAVARAIRQYPVELGSGAECILIFGETHWGAAKILSRHTKAPILVAMRSDSIEENSIYLKTERVGLAARLRLRLSILRETLRERDIARHARWIVLQSRFDLENFVKRNPGAKDKAFVIRGDIQQPRFKPEFALANASAGCSRLLFVGNLGIRKGLRYLLEALAMARDSGCTGLSLDILAAGTDYSAFQAFIDSRGLTGSVRFHGKVASPLPYMRDADLLIVPSLFDSYPNTVLEALHVGLPVIGSRVGGIPDMLASDDLLFEPASAAAIAKKLIVLHSDAESYKNIREFCVERRPYFDFDWPAEWEKITEKSGVST